MAVFSLNEVRSLQVKNKNTNFTSWPEFLEKSNVVENYVFLGSNVSKYTFTTDTVSLPGNQIAAWTVVNSSQGTVHANYLGAGVGYLSGNPSLVQKFDVTNETNTSLPGAIPSSESAYGSSMSLTHSPTAFYAHGGFNPPLGKTNINRMPFSDETIVNIGGGAFGRNSQSTLSSPVDDAGFIFAGERYGGGGAQDYNEMSSIERFTFSTETDSILGSFPGTVYIRRGTTREEQYGYLSGGVNIPPSAPPPASDTNSIHRYEFGTGTIASVPGLPFPVGRGRFSHGMRSGKYGYFGGGYKHNGGINYSNVYRLEFDTGSFLGPFTVFPMNVGGAQALLGAASAVKPNHNAMQYAYAWGGQPSSGDGNAYGYINVFELATGTPQPSLSEGTPALQGGAVTSTHEYAWRMGGEGPHPPNPARKSYIQRFDFSGNSDSIRSGTHPNPTGLSSGLSLQTRTGDRGYFSHFWPVARQVVKQENQTETLSDLGDLYPDSSLFTYNGQSTESYGYAFGGMTPSNSVRSIITRLDFTSETVSTLSPLPGSGRIDSTGAASPQHAHIFGGRINFNLSTVDRYEYSTETAASFPSNMPYSTRACLAVSDTQNVILSGGYQPGPPYVLSNKAKLTFSDDTFSTLPGPYFSMAHYGDTGFTNSPFK